MSLALASPSLLSLSCYNNDDDDDDDHGNDDDEYTNLCLSSLLLALSIHIFLTFSFHLPASSHLTFS